MQTRGVDLVHHSWRATCNDFWTTKCLMWQWWHWLAKQLFGLLDLVYKPLLFFFFNWKQNPLMDCWAFCLFLFLLSKKAKKSSLHLKNTALGREWRLSEEVAFISIVPEMWLGVLASPISIGALLLASSLFMRIPEGNRRCMCGLLHSRKRLLAPGCSKNLGSESVYGKCLFEIIFF